MNQAFLNITLDLRERIALITLNRPQVLNAINAALIDELNLALDTIEKSPAIKCSILTGSSKAFAAGADVSEMQDKTFISAYLEDFLTTWDRIAQRRKPIIAAVGGYALGGGCELAMMCDFIVAADNAKFGQPEINLGTLPGAGGTQRLTRLIGKSKAMDMCLSGRFMDVSEAERAGLVSRIVPLDSLIEESIKIAKTIAEKPSHAIFLTKESINRAYETTLAEGMRFERRLFHAAFSTDDQKEGMAAFVQKRKPNFAENIEAAAK